MTTVHDDRTVAIGLSSCDHQQMGGRLVGREAELERIAGAVMNARRGASRCLLVTGEAGIGKSRLVTEALAGLEDALVLAGHAVDVSTGEIPFGVVADTLRDLVRVDGSDVLLPDEREALAPLLPRGSTGASVDRVRLLSAFLDLLERLSPDDLERVVDESWDPPVTAGVRWLSIVEDCFMHLGQAQYAAGLRPGG